MQAPDCRYLEGRDSEVYGWVMAPDVGQMKECCSFTTCHRDLLRADKCSGSVGHVPLQGQESQKIAVGMIFLCSKSGMTCLALKSSAS